MFSSKYTSLIALGIGLLIGIFFVHLFSKKSGAPPPIAAILQTEQTRAKVNAATQTYHASFDSLHKINAVLSASLSNAKVSLVQAKSQYAQLQNQVLTLLDNKPSPAFTADSVCNDCACDTLRKSVAVMITANTKKDSLYENALSVSDSLLKGKDIALDLTVKQKDFLSEQLDTALSKQEALIREDLYYQDKYHKQKKKTFLAVVGTIVLSALGVLLTHH